MKYKHVLILLPRYFLLLPRCS